MTSFQDFQRVGQDMFEKSVHTGAAVTQSFQSIALEMADVAKKHVDGASAHVEQLTQVRSLDKAVELQSAYLKSAFETGVQQAQRFGELFMDAAKVAARPGEAPAQV